MDNKHSHEEALQPTLSRRGFLAGVSGGIASGMLARPEGAASTLAEGRAAGLLARQDRFGRMFPGLPAFASPTPKVQNALMELGRPGGILDARDPLEVGPVRLISEPALSPNNRDNLAQSAGVTFFGQFVDHDLTFDTMSRLAKSTRPEDATNARTPAADLDTVYGGGPTASPMLYDHEDQDKFRVESGGLFEDLPRRSDGLAIIADPRNDENLIISGLQAAFLLFHNRVVDNLRGQGTPGGQVFSEAQRLVRWHYQWIIINEFLPQIVGVELTSNILTNGRKFYRPQPGEQNIPVEFQGACYRFGHSMVRPSYRANLAGDNGQPFFGFIFDLAGNGQADPVDLRGRARAQRRFIGWQTFFNFGDGQVRPNKRIDTKLSTPLFQLPLSAIPGTETSITSLSQRNLLRHLTWSLPSGQEVAKAMGITPLRPNDFNELANLGVQLNQQTPLWYYTLKEADLIGGGTRLGPMGGRVVAEVIIGLIQLDPGSYLAVNPQWHPTLPSRVPGNFQIIDLLTFAGVDPQSRGQ